MTIKPGALRFNTDSMKLEIFRGSANYEGSASMAGIGTGAAGQWEEIQATSPEVQTGGTRGILMGGYTPGGAYLDEMVFINMSTSGNSQDFGLLTVSGRNHVNVGTSDRTRGLSVGGSKFPGVYTADMEYVTIASEGNSIDFGSDLSEAKYGMGVGADSTRGIIAGGHKTPGVTIKNIDYFNIQTKGGPVGDFGDLTVERRYPSLSFSSPTRCMIGGGVNPGYLSTIDYITTSTMGKAADFGDTRHSMSDHKGGISSNAVRGILMGGNNSGSNVTQIDYFTLSTLGNYQDFGDMPVASAQGGVVASPTRCVKMGRGSPSYSDDMYYVQTMSLGNALTFGDLNTVGTGYPATCSNGHGGL